MAITYKLKYYFGAHCRVMPMTPNPSWSLRSFPGAFGESAVNMGMAGRTISISGQFRYGAFNAADGRRKIYREYIDPIYKIFQENVNLDNDDETFSDCVLLSLSPQYYQMSGSEIICGYVAMIKELTVSGWYTGDVNE